VEPLALQPAFPSVDVGRVGLSQTAQIIAVARHHRSRVRDVAGRYREARRSLHTPASAQSRRGLDWMNFFVADVQTSFGAFVAFYLAELGWSQGSIGVALTAGAIAGTISQIPGGALADAVNWKRGLAALGIAMSAAAALILAFLPHRVFVFVAQILQGATAGVITPAIGAISLGLVGRSAMSLRTGRNYRYAAGGHAVTAALMGVAGAYVANGAIFVAAAALCVPALIALGFIRGDEIDYARARNARRGEAGSGKQRTSAVRILELVRNRKFILFAAATVLFQLADASVLPLVGENLATSIRDHAALWMSGLIIVPQVVVAILAPWVGFHSEKKGRRPLLLIGFGLEPVRAAARVQFELFGSCHRTGLERRHQSHRRRHDGCRRHRPDGGHRALQPGRRHHRHAQRHRRVGEYERHRLRLSGHRAEDGISGTGAHRGSGDRIGLALFVGDEAGKVWRLRAEIATKARRPGARRLTPRNQAMKLSGRACATSCMPAIETADRRLARAMELLSVRQSRKLGISINRRFIRARSRGDLTSR